MLFHPHLVFLPRWLLAAALLRPGESPRRSWTPLSTAGRFYATTGLHLPRATRRRHLYQLATLLHRHLLCS